MKKKPNYTFFLFRNWERREEAVETLLQLKVKFSANLRPPYFVRIAAQTSNRKDLDLMLEFDNALSTF